MDWKELEEVTSQIATSIYGHVEHIIPEQVKFGGKNRWTGASGYRHQIDVSVQGPKDLILVECKYWKNLVKPKSILAFYGRIADIASTVPHLQIHGVFVTTKVLGRNASMLAKYFGIDHQVINSPSSFGFRYKGLGIFGRDIQSRIPHSVTISAVVTHAASKSN